ncbi:hypothetical protein C8F04DRAFT_1398646 [Mycena alexandri]|uniref:Uncharacterized protein n=1 Tax=Mycena alexandri TaxID=1745969 RepID=A0AAD6SLE3_9AGAR|nr:hypothetical protein C8F04DRAFT_1398646 [Mycena alexandri]
MPLGRRARALAQAFWCSGVLVQKSACRHRNEGHAACIPTGTFYAVASAGSSGAQVCMRGAEPDASAEGLCASSSYARCARASAVDVAHGRPAHAIALSPQPARFEDEAVPVRPTPVRPIFLLLLFLPPLLALRMPWAASSSRPRPRAYREPLPTRTKYFFALGATRSLSATTGAENASARWRRAALPRWGVRVRAGAVGGRATRVRTGILLMPDARARRRCVCMRDGRPATRAFRAPRAVWAWSAGRELVCVSALWSAQTGSGSGAAEEGEVTTTGRARGPHFARSGCDIHAHDPSPAAGVSALARPSPFVKGAYWWVCVCVRACGRSGSGRRGSGSAVRLRSMRRRRRTGLVSWLGVGMWAASVYYVGVGTGGCAGHVLCSPTPTRRTPNVLPIQQMRARLGVDGITGIPISLAAAHGVTHDEVPVCGLSDARPCCPFHARSLCILYTAVTIPDFCPAHTSHIHIHIHNSHPRPTPGSRRAVATSHAQPTPRALLTSSCTPTASHTCIDRAREYPPCKPLMNFFPLRSYDD